MKFRSLVICLSLLTAFSAASPKTNASQTATEEASDKNVSIRRIDFRNFTYPLPKDLVVPGNPKNTLKLKNGELPIIRDSDGLIIGGASLTKINYGDVTGDQIEDAVIYISLVSGGSGMPGIVYVYSTEGKKPKLLWRFATGDRANEGYKKAYASKANLVVELFSPIDSRGACCPTKFTRTIYEWQGAQFKQKRKLLLHLKESD